MADFVVDGGNPLDFSFGFQYGIMRMANTVPSTPDLPDPQAFAPGVTSPTESVIGDVYECLNHAMAYACMGQVWQQGWPDAECSRSGTTEAAVTEAVPVAMVSSRHTTATCYVLMSGSGTTARIKSANAGDTAVFAGPGAGTALIGPVSLTLADGGSGFEELTLTLQGAPAVTCTVYQIVVSVDPLSSPLAAGSFDSATPFGVGASAAADQPLSAARGKQIIDTINALFERPRQHLTWAQLIASAVDGNGVPEMPAHGVEMLSYQTGRSRTLAETTVRLKASGGASGGSVYVDTPNRSQAIAAAAGSAWYSLTDTRNGRGETIESPDGRVVIVKSRLRDVATGEMPATTVASVTSMAVFGP